MWLLMRGRGEAGEEEEDGNPKGQEHFRPRCQIEGVLLAHCMNTVPRGLPLNHHKSSWSQWGRLSGEFQRQHLF